MEALIILIFFVFIQTQVRAHSFSYYLEINTIFYSIIVVFLFVLIFFKIVKLN